MKYWQIQTKIFFLRSNFIQNDKTTVINTNKLGTSFQSEEAFENKDASPLTIDTDMLNHKRNTSNPIVGPFESIKKGKNYFKIFTTKR